MIPIPPASLIDATMHSIPLFLIQHSHKSGHVEGLRAWTTGRRDYPHGI
ncbi:hypothetical protein PoMZ_12681 [Pyricularia oryzae]|uniref:Uncharacterized protein n=1 Tax=Pyricularia oryzae TaxID=318829 RepID=A0A4V1C856_PYROR|nr:hypothetical protein PoMZ_12681 [Pyricularia oryzae]